MSDRRVIETIPVEVRRIRRRRTRIGLSFDPSGYVIMEAPLDATEADISSVIREHRAWLRHRLRQAQVTAATSGALRYVTGETIHYFGEPHELVVREGQQDCVRIAPRQHRQLSLFELSAIRGDFQVFLGPAPVSRSGVTARRSDRARSLVNAWFKARAAEAFARVIEHYRRRLPWLGGRAPVWRQRFMRSQWGSCSQSGRISLNTHLVKLPPRLVQYVVLHELCHLRHHDHSARYYELLGRYMPDWEIRRRELDRYVPVLMQD